MTMWCPVWEGETMCKRLSLWLVTFIQYFVYSISIVLYYFMAWKVHAVRLETGIGVCHEN